MRAGFLRTSVAPLFFSLAFCISQAGAQVGKTGGDQMVKMTEGMSTASIRLVDSTGKTIDMKAQLRLTATKIPVTTSSGTVPTNFEGSARHGSGRIEGVPPGDYVLKFPRRVTSTAAKTSGSFPLTTRPKPPFKCSPIMDRLTPK